MGEIPPKQSTGTGEEILHNLNPPPPIVRQTLTLTQGLPATLPQPLPPAAGITSSSHSHRKAHNKEKEEEKPSPSPSPSPHLEVVSHDQNPTKGSRYRTLISSSLLLVLVVKANPLSLPDLLFFHYLFFPYPIQPIMMADN